MHANDIVITLVHTNEDSLLSLMGHFTNFLCHNNHLAVLNWLKFNSDTNFGAQNVSQRENNNVHLGYFTTVFNHFDAKIIIAHRPFEIGF